MAEMIEDWDDRELCPDGACTGVLDEAGVCPTCGKTGQARAGKAKGSSAKPQPVLEVAKEAAAKATPASDDIEDRELCPDGACIGVIGPDGRCRECGRRRDG